MLLVARKLLKGTPHVVCFVNNIINLPPQPQNPPVAKDVAAGHKYEKEVLNAHGMWR